MRARSAPYNEIDRAKRAPPPPPHPRHPPRPSLVRDEEQKAKNGMDRSQVQAISHLLVSCGYCAPGSFPHQAVAPFRYTCFVIG